MPRVGREACVGGGARAGHLGFQLVGADGAQRVRTLVKYAARGGIFLEGELGPELLRVMEKAWREKFCPWWALRDAYFALRASDKWPHGLAGGTLRELLSGAGPCLRVDSPAVQVPLSTSYQRRLAQARRVHEQREYNKMVASVTPAETAEREREPFSSVKEQVGVGLNTGLMMFGLFVAFYVATMGFFESPAKVYCC